jgi:sulfate adenylyltransferase
MIHPHGGRLVSRRAAANDAEALRRTAAELPAIALNNREMSDLTLIANGAMSPLEGFMGRDAYEHVLDHMRLPSGLPWSLPVTLSVKSDEVAEMVPPFMAALRSPEGENVALMSVEEIYKVDHESEAQRALGTADPAHPGVQYLERISRTYAGGKVWMIERPVHAPFQDYDLDPAQTRALFHDKGWERVVAFQTRNPIHRAHEYLIKCALEMVDGALIHPAMGETKEGDIPAEVRMDCYRALLENYFPADHVALSIFPYAMRYAGPREAIHHAILRQNYGATHFIVGRDHAGVGDYYGTYDAQKIFDNFEAGELGITPIMFEHSFYCRKTQGMASQKTTTSAKEDRVFLSGTKVREMLAAGEPLPGEFTRPEVSAILEAYYGPDGPGSKES